jgi:hypothetical protein
MICCPPKTELYQKLCIYLSHPQDDSYTPSALAIRAGTGPSDLQDVRMVTFDRPDGWITFDVSSEPTEDGDALYVHEQSHAAFSALLMIQKETCLRLCPSDNRGRKPYGRERHACARFACLGTHRVR